MEKKCNCNEPYDSDAFEGGYPRCPVHDALQEKKYPIGGYAPGNYHNRCYTCERSFFGDKRAIQCEECAVNDLRERLKPYEPATPQGIGWVKATERLPNHRDNVIVCGYLNEQGYTDYQFVAFGHKAGPPGNETMYFEYGNRSFLTNDVEWLDEGTPNLG